MPTHKSTHATPKSAHVFVNWAKERLDEMDATLSSLEAQVGKLQAEAGKRAKSAIAGMRVQRDAFGQSIKKQEGANEAAWAGVKNTLEAEWTAFETSVREYFEAAREQAGQQEAAFRARAEAQRKVWQEAIDDLQTATAGFAADRKADVESAVKRMKAEAEAAKTKLANLNRAGTESWSALNKALAETRAVFDRANQAVYDAFNRAA